MEYSNNFSNIEKRLSFAKKAVEDLSSLVVKEEFTQFEFEYHFQITYNFLTSGFHSIFAFLDTLDENHLNFSKQKRTAFPFEIPRKAKPIHYNPLQIKLIEEIKKGLRSSTSINTSDLKTKLNLDSKKAETLFQQLSNDKIFKNNKNGLSFEVSINSKEDDFIFKNINQKLQKPLAQYLLSFKSKHHSSDLYNIRNTEYHNELVKKSIETENSILIGKNPKNALIRSVKGGVSDFENVTFFLHRHTPITQQGYSIDARIDIKKGGTFGAATPNNSLHFKQQFADNFISSGLVNSGSMIFIGTSFCSDFKECSLVFSLNSVTQFKNCKFFIGNRSYEDISFKMQDGQIIINDQHNENTNDFLEKETSQFNQHLVLTKDINLMETINSSFRELEKCIQWTKEII